LIGGELVPVAAHKTNQNLKLDQENQNTQSQKDGKDSDRLRRGAGFVEILRQWSQRDFGLVILGWFIQDLTIPWGPADHRYRGNDAFRPMKFDVASFALRCGCEVNQPTLCAFDAVHVHRLSVSFALGKSFVEAGDHVLQEY
jgi:hypothetical protein